jgi:hypothetical protein
MESIELLNELSIIKKNLNEIQKGHESLQAKCERYEGKLREIKRLSEEWRTNGGNDIFDVLRTIENEALSAGEGEKDLKFDYKQRELERGKAAPEGAIKAMHERWRITGERKECEACGLWYIPTDGCPDCTTNQKEDKR